MNSFDEENLKEKKFHFPTRILDSLSNLKRQVTASGRFVCSKTRKYFDQNDDLAKWLVMLVVQISLFFVLVGCIEWSYAIQYQRIHVEKVLAPGQDCRDRFDKQIAINVAKLNEWVQFPPDNLNDTVVLKENTAQLIAKRKLEEKRFDQAVRDGHHYDFDIVIVLILVRLLVCILITFLTWWMTKIGTYNQMMHNVPILLLLLEMLALFLLSIFSPKLPSTCPDF